MSRARAARRTAQGRSSRGRGGRGGEGAKVRHLLGGWEGEGEGEEGWALEAEGGARDE